MTDISIAINFLKERGYYNRMASLPREAAIKLCMSFFDRQTCTTIVNSMK